MNQLFNERQRRFSTNDLRVVDHIAFSFDSYIDIKCLTKSWKVVKSIHSGKGIIC